MTSLRNFHFFCLTFQTALTVSTITVDTCENGYYYASGSCHPCSLCSSEEVLLQPCTSTSNAGCQHCHNIGELSNTRNCQNCTNCSQLHRKETMVCSPAQDSRCGDCLDGYFLGVTVEGIVECLACSWCPPQDKTIIRWRDCKDAGLGQDMWCSPGYGPPDSYTLYPVNTATFTLHSLNQEATSNLVVDSSNSMIAVASATLIGTILTVCICTLCFCMCRSSTSRTPIHSYQVLTLEQMTTRSGEELIMSRTQDILV